MTEPKLPHVREDYKFEYTPAGNETNSVTEIKRIKRHENVANMFKTQQNFVVPRSQLEGIPGAIDGELCQFDIFNQSFKP